MISLEYTYAELPEQFFSTQPVYKYPNAKLLFLNNSLQKDLNLDLNDLTEKEQLSFLLGYDSKKPISQAYAGHQFGHFTILGDGRATLIGEFEKADGSLVDFHLKGAGLTKFSRGGDGKATLGAMLREYIIGEAMHNLGISTSRILAVILTGEKIQRNSLEQGAIAVRVASSHIRVGTFQYAALQGKRQVQELLDYAITRHSIPVIDGNRALSLLEYVIEKQSSLIVDWERVGFIHGVMNTDNMTISGETIDYGPCAFMDIYNPDTVFSSIDKDGRYGFANQASIAGWNIARLAESLLLLISSDEKEAIALAESKLQMYSQIYKSKWKKMLCNKLGVDESIKDYDEIISDLFINMYQNKLDYTNTFCDLAFKRYDSLKEKGLERWLKKYLINSIDYSKMLLNPIYIPRNHQVEKAIKSAGKSNFSGFCSLLEVIKKPYEYDEDNKNYMLVPSEKEKVKYTFCGT